MTKIKNISYVPYAAKPFIEQRINDKNRRLAQLYDLLTSHGETFEDALKYQADGVDWKRKAKIAECEAYIERTQMPTYLRQSALDAAFADNDNGYIKQLAGVFGSLQLDLTKDVEVLPDKWVVAQHLVDAEIEKDTYTLTDKEMKLFAKYKQMVEIAEELHREYYFFGEGLTYNDELKMCDTDVELAERFIRCQRCTPEEYHRRLAELHA